MGASEVRSDEAGSGSASPGLESTFSLQAGKNTDRIKAKIQGESLIYHSSSGSIAQVYLLFSRLMVPLTPYILCLRLQGFLFAFMPSASEIVANG